MLVFCVSNRLRACDLCARKRQFESVKHFYNTGKQVTTEAAIHSTIFGDLYIAIGDVHENKTQWTTRIWFNPFTLWIWIGVFLLSLGGALSLIKTLRIKY